MGNVRRFFKVNVDFQRKMVQKITIPKSQDVFHYTCRVRDSEHNKKIHYSNFKIVALVINSKIVRKLGFI